MILIKPETLPSGLSTHQQAYMAILTQAKHLHGMDAARDLIRQCRMVRAQRWVELQEERLRTMQSERTVTEAPARSCIWEQTVPVPENLAA